MNDITNATTAKEISTIDALAAQARALRLSINVNAWQLARVFIEAKELVPHGEWGQWLRENADVSERTAQDMMAAYRRFGDNPQFAELGQAKTFKLLPLPEGAEEAFFAEHDVEHMSTREIQEAVRKAREEEREKAEKDALAAEINAATERNRAFMDGRDQGKAAAMKEAEERIRAAVEEAERRALEAEKRTAEIPEDMLAGMKEMERQITEQRAEIDRLAAQGRESLEMQRNLSSENARLQRENREQAEMLTEQQEALNHAQTELLNVRSDIAKGDAERTPADSLSPEAFAAAVRTFIGAVSRMPHMTHVFAGMDHDMIREYTIGLETVAAWCEASRKALNSIYGEGTVVFRG